MNYIVEGGLYDAVGHLVGECSLNGLDMMYFISGFDLDGLATTPTHRGSMQEHSYYRTEVNLVSVRCGFGLGKATTGLQAPT